MNEKEARENTNGLQPIVVSPSYLIGEANGYLEAIEKAKVLEEALKVYHSPMDAHAPKEKIEGCPICKALAKWEKNK